MNETLKSIIFVLVGAISAYIIPLLFQLIFKNRDRAKLLNILKSESVVNLSYSVAIQDDLQDIANVNIINPSDPAHMITCPTLNSTIDNLPVCINTKEMQLLVLLKEAYNSLAKAMDDYRNSIVKPRTTRWSNNEIGILHPDRRAYGDRLNDACDKFIRSSHFVFSELKIPFDNNDPIKGPFQQTPQQIQTIINQMKQYIRNWGR